MAELIEQTDLEVAPATVAANGQGTTPSAAKGDDAPVTRRSRRLRLPPERAGDAAALGGLMALTAFLWGRGRGVWFWIDEGITVGVASQPLADIPASLRLDGAPPLYYLILNVWMSAFGTSEAVTHTLSLLFAVAVVPAALWAGWSLFGRRAGWICALLAAVNPYLADYANETRMYSLVVLLVVLSTATFVHTFVFARRRYLPAFVVTLTLLAYTHSWGLLFGVGAGVAAVLCAVLGPDRRRTVIDATLAFGAVALLYLPWVPTLLYQLAHDPNPWARRPTLNQIRDDVMGTFGGIEPMVALGVGAFAALVAILERWSTRMALAVGSMLVIPVVVLAGGWVSQVWAYRYLGVVVAPLLLVLGLGLARGGSLAAGVVVLTAFLTAPIESKVPPYQKSNARGVAEEAAPLLAAGDLVVSPDYSQIPLLSYYLPTGLRYAGAHGMVDDVRIADWRNSLERMRRSDPSAALPPLLDQVPVGGHVLVMCPQLVEGPELVEFHRLVSQYCDETISLLRADDRLSRVLAVDAPEGILHTPFDGLVYVKESDAPRTAPG
ncbi:MAG TPA: glycosyltransferase family 39 protein [Acidimicrobiales bacterium]|nr:glycosyltransferase family 39 protein [Acidimicrobiales bacterium]